MKTKLWLIAIAAAALLAACDEVVAPSMLTQRAVHADGVAISETRLVMAVGETQTLTATVSPDNAANKAVLWSSKAPGVATVEDGLVTALEIGTAIISVITKDGGITAQCTVEVAPNVDVYGVTPDKTTLILKEGEAELLTGTAM